MHHGFVVPICIIDDPNSTAVGVMFVPVRISWDQHEVALLIDAYFRVEKGADLHQTATQLSQTLRGIASRSGRSIDDTYRNVNGMVMQLAKVQYLFTDGEKGLSGASAMIRQMVELYRNDQVTYLTILKEAVRMSGNTLSVQDAFFAYAQGEIGLPPRLLEDYLQKAADYCHLKQPFLGIIDVQEVRRIQQKVAKGKLLRFRYGKDAQPIRNVTQLYYNFVKSYREEKEQPAAPVEAAPAVVADEIEQPAEDIAVNPNPETVELVQSTGVSADVDDESPEEYIDAKAAETDDKDSSDALWVNFSVDNSYLFTKPNYYIYQGERHDAKSWNRLYVEVCGLLFADHHDAFMGIMNGDIPGYNALIFADEQNYRRMRTPKPFAPGYYLESNLDATSIVRKLSGLYRLFNVGDGLQISYRTVDGYQPSQPKTHKKIGNGGQLSVDTDYNWYRDGLRLVDFTEEVSYAFTQPEAYEYNAITKRVNKWGKLYADLCGVLFEDYHDAFMGIMNGDIPGYNALAFADEQHKAGLRVARCFAPGYYLESNLDATTIVRKIRGLHQLFGLGHRLRISYVQTDGANGSVQEKPVEKWLLHELRKLNIPYVDNRSNEGCLWIASDMSIPISLSEAANHGYRLRFKPDGCRAFPNRPVLWTKDQPVTKDKSETADNLEGFKQFLLEKQNLADRTANGYASALRSVESYIRQNNLGVQMICDHADEAQKTIDLLMARLDFVKMNQERHYQYLAAMKQYGILRQAGHDTA